MDFARQLIGRWLRQRGQHAESAGIGDRRREFGPAHPLHAPLNDGVAYAQQFGDPGFHALCSRTMLRAITICCIWLVPS